MYPIQKALSVLTIALAALTASAAEPPVEITVHRSPTCGCCGKWIDHMKSQGFVIKDLKHEDMDSVKAQLGVPAELQSCHTAEVKGLIVEGHVPAEDVRKALASNSPPAGVAVPGMPAGTPGMEMGGRRDPYATVAFDKSGSRILTNHPR